MGAKRDRLGEEREALLNKIKIKGCVGGWGSTLGKSRRKPVIMTRFRLGYCSLAWNLALIGNHKDGLCDTCKKTKTVQHVFIKCRKYKEVRRIQFSEVMKAYVKAVSLRSLLEPPDHRVAGAVVGFIFGLACNSECDACKLLCSSEVNR